VCETCFTLRREKFDLTQCDDAQWSSQAAKQPSAKQPSSQAAKQPVSRCWFLAFAGSKKHSPPKIDSSIPTPGGCTRDFFPIKQCRSKSGGKANARVRLSTDAKQELSKDERVCQTSAWRTRPSPTGLTGDDGEAAFRICEKLQVSLGKPMGSAGFRALFSRAVALAGADVPWLQGLHIQADGTLESLAELKSKLTNERSPRAKLRSWRN